MPSSNNSRIVILFGFVALAWMAIITRAGYLQIFPNHRLDELYEKQFQSQIELPSRRGPIFDRNGQELAVSITSRSVFADPSEIENARVVAPKLAKLFRLSEKNLRARLKEKSRRFIWIARHINKKQEEAIRKLGFRGIGLIDEPLRIYPNNNLLSQVLGFVGTDGEGLEGIEHELNQKLRGEKKRVTLQKDARGRPLLSDASVLTDLPEGESVTLTIDHDLQYVLEQELAQALKEFSADTALGIIMDPKTGEILAMSSFPTFDPNDWKSFPAQNRRNRTVTDTFEPGSTMKTFVIASALKNKVAKPSTKYFCEGGKFKVGDKMIREAEARHNFEWLTMTEILSFSSNIGVTKIAFDVKAEGVYSTLKEFGFGDSTGSGLPGESRGQLKAPKWVPHLLANISFGHGMMATPLQVTSAYAAVANGGYLLRPRIVRQIGDKGPDLKPDLIRQVLSTEEAETIKLMLMSATSETGTGKNARVPGFPVAGKTGTAQKVDAEVGGYKKDSYFSSFAGFVPTNDPQFVIYIALDNPKSSYYGAQVAAPVFSRVARYALRQRGVAPILISKTDVMERSRPMAPEYQKNQEKSLKKVQQLLDGSSVSTRMPDVVGMPLREALDNLRMFDVKVLIKGKGAVARTWPRMGDEIPQSRKVHIELDRQ